MSNATLTRDTPNQCCFAPFFTWAKHRKSHFSDFLCSLTPQKRLLRMLGSPSTMFVPDWPDCNINYFLKCKLHRASHLILSKVTDWQSICLPLHSYVFHSFKHLWVLLQDPLSEVPSSPVTSKFWWLISNIHFCPIVFNNHTFLQ